jgi:hypothetical protein
MMYHGVYWDLTLVSSNMAMRKAPTPRSLVRKIIELHGEFFIAMFTGE